MRPATLAIHIPFKSAGKLYVSQARDVQRKTLGKP
jgi:hypothetical protein